jgi:hypothetical protein
MIIKKGQQVFVKPQFLEGSEKDTVFISVDEIDTEKDINVLIQAIDCTLPIVPIETVSVGMLDLNPH